MNTAADVLNRAFATDPRAVESLIRKRVPCNQALAEDPTIVVGESPICGNDLGTLGLINGILTELGHQVVAAQFSDDPGHTKLLGFVPYSPPTSTR